MPAGPLLTLEQYHFTSTRERAQGNFGPAFVAALEDNANIVRAACVLDGINVNETLTFEIVY